MFSKKNSWRIWNTQDWIDLLCLKFHRKVNSCENFTVLPLDNFSLNHFLSKNLKENLISCFWNRWLNRQTKTEFMILAIVVSKNNILKNHWREHFIGHFSSINLTWQLNTTKITINCIWYFCTRTQSDIVQLKFGKMVGKFSQICSYGWNTLNKTNPISKILHSMTLIMNKLDTSLKVRKFSAFMMEQDILSGKLKILLGNKLNFYTVCLMEAPVGLFSALDKLKVMNSMLKMKYAILQQN